MIDFNCALHQTRHVRQAGERVGQRELRQHDRAFGDIGRVIADPLEIAGDLQRRDDLAQVVGDRLAQRQQADDEGLDLALQRIDLRILLDRARR